MAVQGFSNYGQGCQIGFFDAKFEKFGFFRGSWRQKNCLAFWLFLFNIWLFLEGVGTYYQTGVLAFKISS